MPRIRIADDLGLELEIEPKFASSITKYFKDPFSFKISNLSELQNISLKDVPVTALQVGLELEQDVEIGNDETEMTISAGVPLGARLFKENDESLFPNHFGEASNIKVRENRPYLAFSISPTLGSRFSHSPGELTFGFESGSTLTIANYKPFQIIEERPSFIDALRETLQEFVLPGDLEDLTHMSVGTVASVDGSSHLKFSAGLTLAAAGNPLATVDAPDPVGQIKVKAGASLDLNASFSLKSELQLRLHKLDENTIELGYYKKDGSKAEIGVTAAAGVSVARDGKDLIEPLINALSSEPEVDVEELKNAGLSSEAIADISAAISAGVNRSLELSLAAEFSSLRAGAAAFLYKIDIRQLDANGRQILHRALDGDLTGLVGSEEDPLRGIEPIRSIVTTLRKAGATLKVNLLGIYNFISISELLVKGAVQYEHETGELIISDEATAKRIRASINNLAADSEKLRKLYAESFLFTAGYRGSTLGSAGPNLDSTHSYFELHRRTNRQTMKDNLDVPQGLGFLKEEEKNELLGDLSDFGSSTLYAEAGYDDEILGDLFVDAGGNPLPTETYENAGRRALSLLVQEGDPSSFRRQPALDDKLWTKMKRAGNEQQQMSLFNLKDVQLKVIHSDYIVIMWWAAAMRQMGEQLAKTREFLGDNPNLEIENKKFKKVRSQLLKRIRSVAKATKTQFGDPWGLLAMDQLARGAGRAKVKITGEHVALNLKR